jgi:hypothetical protein
MTRKSAKNKLSKVRSDLALEMLLQGEKTLAQIAEALDVPLRTIADWAMNPLTCRRAFSFSRLHTARAAVFANSLKSNATVSLYAMAKSEDGGETARKACVDLLKLDLSKQGRDEPQGEGTSEATGPSPRPMRPEDVMLAMQMVSTLDTQKEAYRS